MSKDKVYQQLDTSWELPEVVSKLKHVTEEVEKAVPTQRTKEMMYELLDVVLGYGERLHDLEIRICYGDPTKEKKRAQESLRVSAQKQRRDSVIKPRRTN